MTAHDVDLQFSRNEPPTEPHTAPPERPFKQTAWLYAAVSIVLLICTSGLLPPALAPKILPLRQSGMLFSLLSAVVLAGTCIGSRAAILPGAGAIAAIGLALTGVFAGRMPAFLPPAEEIALASVAVFASFPLLVAERMIAALPQGLPGRIALRRLAMLPIACLLIAAISCLGDAASLPLLRPASLMIGVILCLAGAELSFRMTIAYLAPQRSHAPLDLLLLRPLGLRLSRQSWASRLRDNFGIDFARSWALHFCARAALPVSLVLLAMCVLLTGTVRIDTEERGIYQRLGHPVAVLDPGLHLLLPWPLGQVRRVEYGVIHAVPISFGDADTSPDASLSALIGSGARVTAEGPPPATANRLWDSSQPSDVTYLIASEEAGESRQHGGFELISVSMRVFYRIGLDPLSARRAAYAVADPTTLVRMAASRLLARHLATRTLPQVLVEDRAHMSQSLRASLQDLLDRLHTGIEILSISVEAAHPPAGAAIAYRQVQAAEITAHIAVSLERGRAESTAGLALRDAEASFGSATAAAAERIAGAQAQRTTMLADDFAYRASHGAFLLEYRLSALQSALSAGNFDLLDPRLDGALDLRMP